MLSQHPADRLIRDLLATRRPATPEEVNRIIVRMTSAPFDPRIVRVPPALHEVVDGAAIDSLTLHLAKRTFVEQQWAEGTTTSEYLADLRRAVQASTARYLMYARRGGILAACIVPTTDVLPPERRGVSQIDNMLVVYSVDRGGLITGYQFSNLTETGIPGDHLWLN